MKRTRGVKRLAGALLALVMVLGMIPGTVWTAEAATGIQARLDEILKVYPSGSYFTVASATSGCASSNHDTVNGNWCMGCYLPNIPARGNLPSGAAVGWTADTCCGFANYVYYCIFGHSRSSKTKTTTKPVLGDLVYTGTHWFIYLSEDSTNYYVYDANGYNGAKNKVIYNNYYPKNKVTSLTVYHATDYDDIIPTPTYQSITAGTYYLRNKTAAYLNADGTANKSNLSVTSLKTVAAQRFVVSGGISNSISASFDSTLRVNPFSDTPTNGTNVNLYSGTEIGSDMHWCFEAVSGGYIIHNFSYPSLVLGLDGTNVRVETKSGASDQIWELIPATYTIYYNALGGSGAPAAQTKKFSENLTLSAAKPTLSGYTFKGWATTANAATAQYQPGGSYAVNGGATLYAVWEKESEPVTLTGITVASTPTKTVYEIGEALDTAGLTLTAAYSDGSTQTIITGYTVSGFDSATAGEKTVTVTYEGKTASFTVTVNEAAPVTPPTDPTAAAVYAQTVSGRLGETVTLALSVRNNPGVAYLKLKVNYDSALELVSATNGGIINGTFTTSKTTEVKPYVLTWTGTENSTDSGCMAQLTFRIAEDAEDGAYTVMFDCDEAYNEEFDDVTFTMENATVEVKSFVYGDLNDDGSINGKDAILLARYLAEWDVLINMDAADVNADGKVNGKDAIVLARYLAEWDVTLGQ